MDLRIKRNIIPTRLLTAIVALIFSMSVSAQVSEPFDPSGDPYPDYLEEIYMDMDFEPNLATPVVPKTALKALSEYQIRQAKQLMHRMTVDMFRDDDVFVVSIPSDDLFLPNDTLLSKYAHESLSPLLPLMKDPYKYKIVVAVHTDDTGSEEYREDLSRERLNSIYDWMMDEIDKGQISEDIIIIPFSMASNDPIVENDTRDHRQENRRVEFYFVPGPELIRQAESGQLK